MLDRHLKKTLQDFAYGSGRITILTGAGNLPNQVVLEVKNRDGIIIDINIEENPFSNLALKSRRGFFIKQPSSKALPSILQVFKEILE
jgi:NAD-dependent deacetylase